MRRQLRSAIALGAILSGGGMQFFFPTSAARAQSELVFMTAEDIGTVIQSRVYRFDMGMLTNSFNDGLGAAFQGIAALGNELLVADYADERIERYSLGGAFLGTFASMTDPAFLEVDSSNNVYSTALLNASAPRRMNSSGGTTQLFTHANLTNPRGIDADADGNVYIANAGGPSGASLFKFASNGAFMSSTSIGATLGSVIIGVDFNEVAGTVLAAEQFNALIDVPSAYEFTPGGVLLDTYTPTGAEIGFDIVAFNFIPEPASAALMLVAVGAIAAVRRP